MKALYPDWKKQAGQLTTYEDELRKARPVLDIWRAMDPVVPALYEALMKEIEASKGPTKGLESAFAKHDAKQSEESAKELGEALFAFFRCWERVQRLHTS